MKTLRLFTLAFAFTLLGNISKAQWVSIPDSNFGKWLKNNGYTTCLQGNSTTGWQMDTSCNKVISDTSLLCYSSSISNLSGIQYFDNLKILRCNNNSITTIPSLPSGLREFMCLSNSLTTLPVLPAGLKELNCEANQLTGLPPLPAGLTELSCGNAQFTGLPAQFPTGLTDLIIQGSAVTSLPAFPATLKFIYLPNNQQLLSVPALPAGLIGFNCVDGQFTTLPPVPQSLTYFAGNNNPWVNLPVFPLRMTEFYCTNCNMDTMPAFEGYMIFLDVRNNNITTVNQLPDSVSYLYLDSNPITCLPPLGYIRNFYYPGTNIECLPNYPTGSWQSYPFVQSMPLCDMFNTNGCDWFNNIKGTVYMDTNGNCQFDNGEPTKQNVKLQLWSNGTLLRQTTTAGNGTYSFNTDAYATYQISVDTASTPFSVQCPATGSLTTVITVNDSTNDGMDFAILCKPGFDLEAKSISTGGIFRPANFTTVEVDAGNAGNYYNMQCTPASSGTVTLSFTGPAKYIAPEGSALTPTVTGNTLTWNIANFGTVNFFEDFDVIMQTDTTAQLGQQVCFTLTASPTAGDNNPANNTLTHCFTVVNSFDPNDKAVYPSGNIDTAQRDLVYTIRFQNTGNAEAQHIYITDTLSSSINPASFQLLAYSHQPMVQLDGNKLRFNFPNINLPDSTTNEPASHGYVQFKVKLNNGLPVGTVINNTAYIYFDFNAPVVTNTTTNTIYIPAQPVVKPVSIGKYRIDRAVKPNGKL